MTIFGWDASDYDWQRRPLDLIEAKAAGISFFTHKATEGTRVAHMHCGRALTAARNAGIPLIGAYMVPRTPVAGKDGPVIEQVAYLLRYLDANAPWWRTFPGWFFQVDLERWQYDSVSPEIGVATCQTIEQATGHRPVLYASRGQYGDSIPSTRYPLWNASYAHNPAEAYTALYRGDGSSDWLPYSGQAPIILQYGSQATIGTQRMCDINAFRGTVDQLRAALGISGGTFMSDDFGSYGKPPAVADRTTAVMLTDLWGQEVNEDSPFHAGDQTARTRRLVALTAAVAAIDKKVTALADSATLTDADRAAIVAQLKSCTPTAHDVAAAIIDTLRSSAPPVS